MALFNGLIIYIKYYHLKKLLTKYKACGKPECKIAADRQKNVTAY